MIDDNVIEIGIYDIDDNGNLSQRGLGGREGVLRFAPASIPLAEDGDAISPTERLDLTLINIRHILLVTTLALQHSSKIFQVSMELVLPKH